MISLKASGVAVQGGQRAQWGARGARAAALDSVAQVELAAALP